MTKALLVSAAALALFVTPGLAQQKNQTTGQGAQQQYHRLFTGEGIIKGNDVYDCTGKYLGSDPDPNIRHQLLREGDSTCGQ